MWCVLGLWMCIRDGVGVMVFCGGGNVFFYMVIIREKCFFFDGDYEGGMFFFWMVIMGVECFCLG